MVLRLVKVLAKDIQKRLLNLLSCRVTDVFFSWRHRRKWLDTRSLGRAHEIYFDNYLTRMPIIDAVAKVIEVARIAAPRIIEFGCSGGNNLRLMHEKIPVQLEYCGLDIQDDAIAFARSHFPNDTFYRCGDAELASAKPMLGHFDIFLISGVLYYLPQKESQEVLNLAAEMADWLVVCEDLKRFHLPTGENEGLFIHPFGIMCEKAGFEIVVQPRNLAEGERHGLFVARSRHNQR